MSNTNIQNKPEDALEAMGTVPATHVSGDDEDPEDLILTPQEFRSILERTIALGIEWTADLPPALVLPKNKDKFESEAFDQIQEKYPHFPYDLGNVIFYALTGAENIRSVIGSIEEAEQKAAIVRELLISQRPDFRSEFFFKYAIKVPYFFDLDWEIVIKAFERNVREMPQIPYALLSLVFRRPINPILSPSQRPEYEMSTVAVDERLIDKLILSLTQAKQKLQDARRIAECLDTGNAAKDQST